MIPFQFVQPIALLLLLTLPFFLLRWRKLGELSPARGRTALAIRLLIALFLIFSLAQMQFQRKTDLLSVLFALDLSESVPSEEREAAYATIQEAVEAMGKNDQAGVVIFGKDAVLDVPVQPFLEWERPTSVYEDDATNIASGLRLALAALPAESQKRVVLFSDGNENRGAVQEEVKRLSGLGIPVEVYPLRYQTEAEVYVDKIVYPGRINEEEPIDLDVFIQSRQDTPAKLRLFLQDELVREQPVDLKEGKNKFTVPSLRIPRTKLYKLEVRVEAEADTSIENNRAVGFVSVLGKPNILAVEGDLRESPEAGREFVAQLRAEGIEVHQAAPGEIPTDPSQLLAYDAVVLSNVSASEMTQDQMTMLERSVHDIGIGLVMVGGPESFAAGGYRDTPIERALPVDMEIKDRKIIPSGALVVVLHTCEIPMGNDVMRKVAIESIRVLDPKDEVGMLEYSYRVGGPKWIFPLVPKGNGRKQIALIKKAESGDMPDFGSAMKLGYNSLRVSGTNMKHMVILSDGDPQPPTLGLLNQFASSGITVSTVLVGGHGGNFRGVMSNIAKTTGGKFYDVQNPNLIPRIFTREAARVKRNLVVEEVFQPLHVADTEITENFEPDGYPPLLGYIIASPKAGAETPLLTHHEDPLLAHWRYGLGKTLAFTSDYKTKWGVNWIEWEGFGRFWAQAIRWVSRKEMAGDYRVSTYREEGKGRIVVDAFDSEGKALNYLALEGRVVTPDQEVLPLRLVQTDLGRYEADFDLDSEGSYLVNVFDKDMGGDQGTITAALSVPYSPEFSSDRSNTRLLREIAEGTGGRFQPDLPGLFDHTLVAHSRPFPMWPWLLALGVFLFWWDVFVRRVLIDWSDVKQGARQVVRRMAPHRTIQTEATMERLKKTKEEALPARQEAPAVSPAIEKRFDFDSLEKKEAEGISLEKPEGRKAAPAKREAAASSADRALERESASTTERLLDLKKKLDKK